MSETAKSVHPEGSRQQQRSRDDISDAGRKWREENAEAAKDWEVWVENNGLPLEQYRQF